MDKKDIIEHLSDYDKSQVEKFSAYCVRLINEKDSKTKELKNPWMQYKKPEELASLFVRVNGEGLVFDGVHITLQSTGISYDYVAYKNKMLLVYPETRMDVGIVYEGDEFSFSKENGEVKYFHNISNPFGNSDDKIIGLYTIIRNKRGEFITLLNKDDIKKHRSVAKTDYIWKAWFSEMCIKTVVKKACKLHFGDVFQEIEEMDNENYDLDKVNIPSWRSDIDNIKTMEELKDYYSKNMGIGKEFYEAVKIKKSQLG